jgi:hypothetical protein
MANIVAKPGKGPQNGKNEPQNGVPLGLVNKLSSILDCRQTSFGWLRLRLAVSAQHQKSTSL